MDAVSQPDIDTPFASATFNDFEVASTAGNPILIDEKQGK